MRFRIVSAFIVLLLIGGASVRAQEPELVNEIVARVNNEIITRADYLSAVAEFRAEMSRQMQQQGKGQAEIEAEIQQRMHTVLDLLIEDLLLEQKARELGIDVEADVNVRLKQIAEENGFKDVLEFERALTAQGISPESARGSLRRQLQQTYVVQQEVLGPIYRSIKDDQRREYYDKNQGFFTMPGEVTLSEIFLPLDNQTAAEVEQRARRLVAELRAGQDFGEAVQRHSPAGRASRGQNGKLGSFTPDELKEDLAKAISTLNAGDVTEPIRLQDGYQIVKVDERKPSTLVPFEDPRVRSAIDRQLTMEKAETERKKYIDQLREDAYITVDEKYATTFAKTTN